MTEIVWRNQQPKAIDGERWSALWQVAPVDYRRDDKITITIDAEITAAGFVFEPGCYSYYDYGPYSSKARTTETKP